jgi:hypothetical protein
MNILIIITTSLKYFFEIFHMGLKGFRPLPFFCVIKFNNS